MNSPCYSCTRVRDPQNCENKLCKDWQAWFIDRWETMREHIRLEMELTQTRELGVPLGGNRYANPHQIREYLENDPCDRCQCPKNICHTPCPVKIAWVEKVNEVNR